MQYFLIANILLAIVEQVQSLSYDPGNYLEVYPDPRDPEVLKGRTPLYFALIMSLGGPLSQVDTSGNVGGVKVALDRINNDSSLLPGYTLHYTFADSKCNRTESLNALYSQLRHEPTKLAIIGSGCDVATEPAAEVSHYYNITQISCSTASASLGDRARFPRYFQLLTAADITVIGFFGVIKEYGWRRIAFIIQDEDLFKVNIARLKVLFDQEGVEYREKMFNSSAGIPGLGLNPFAYKRGYTFPQRMFLTPGAYDKNWWKIRLPGLTCTIDQIESVLRSTIAVSAYFFLDETSDANFTTTPGITGGDFFVEERKFFGKPPLNFTAFQYSSYCHDATWTLAYALNKTLSSITDEAVNEEIAQAYNITPSFRLENFTYNNHKLMEIIFQHLSNTSFGGLTGPVSFGAEGLRDLKTLIVSQYRDVQNTANKMNFLDRIEIGNVHLINNSFTYGPGEGFNTVWNDLLTYDGVPQNKTNTVHPATSTVYILFSCAGIIFAIACLTFNFFFRNTRLIKLASTKLNYLIGIGAIVLYLDTLVFVIPTTDPDMVNVFCNLTSWLTAIGYSLCYGTILAKMARVYYIFNNPSTDKKVAKDWVLMMGVAFLVAIDLIILVTYSIVEGVRGNLIVLKVTDRENPVTIEGELEIITNNFVHICDSTARDIFLGVLFGYKMLLQIFALFLAFAIRKVKVKGLNDAKYIAATVYVTSIVLAVIIVATYSLRDFVNGYAALFCTGFLVGTTVILLFVFMPLMVGLYNDPKGESIVISALPSYPSSKESEKVFTEAEVQGLQRRIKELEEKIKMKDDGMSGVGHA